MPHRPHTARSRAVLALLTSVALGGCPIGGEDSGEHGDEVGNDESRETDSDSGRPEDDTEESTDDTDDTGESTSESGEESTTETTESSSEDSESSTDTDTSGTESTDTDTDTDTTGETPPCFDESWAGDEFPTFFFFDTTEFDDQVDASCTSAATREWRLRFTAPWAGTFRFRTHGSDFDTVLYAHPGECGEPELACNDNFNGLASRLKLDLEAGETITVTVEGAHAFAEGPGQLKVNEVPANPCWWTNIGPGNLPKTVQGNTGNFEDSFDSACGGFGAPEKLYRFVAPEDGVYRFSTEGSSFDTVLYAWDLAECGEVPPFVCNDDSGFDTDSTLLLDLDEGQKIVVGVDGFGPGDFGPFLLHVEAL